MPCLTDKEDNRHHAILASEDEQGEEDHDDASGESDRRNWRQHDVGVAPRSQSDRPWNTTALRWGAMLNWTMTLHDRNLLSHHRQLRDCHQVTQNSEAPCGFERRVSYEVCHGFHEVILWQGRRQTPPGAADPPG